METIGVHSTLKVALTRIGDSKLPEDQILFVVNDIGQLVGSLTNGDIRRAILNGVALETNILNVMNNDPKSIKTSDLSDFIDLSSFRNKGIYQIPIVDEENTLTRVISTTDKISLLPFDAVIMAGGRGKRLSPLTDAVPKPMLKLADKPILEWILDELIKYDVKNIYLSVNYLSNQIKSHFGSFYRGVPITYLEENKPLGTAGALGFIPTRGRDLLVTNGDVLNNVQLDEMYRYHKEKSAIASVASIKHEYKVPFAVMENSKGLLTNIVEKPTMTYECNAGIYMLSDSVTQMVNQNEYLDMPDLIENISNNKVGSTYIFNHLGYWLDIGTPKDFEQAQSFMQYARR